MVSPPVSAARVRELERSHDAMRASVDSLQVLLANERAQTRVAKRKLAAATKTSTVARGWPGVPHARVDDLRRELAQSEEEVRKMREEVKGGERQRQEWEVERQRLREEVERREREARREERRRAETDMEERESGEREDVGKVQALKEAAELVPALKKRVDELAEEVRMKGDALQVYEDARGEGEKGKNAGQGGAGGVEMKRKLLELKIARNVIVEKDKVVKEMRERLADADARELEAVMAGRMAKEQARMAEGSAAEAKGEAKKVHELLEREEKEKVATKEMVREVQAEVKRLKEENEKLQGKLANVERERVREEQSREGAIKEKQMAENRIAETVAEADAVKAALERAKEQVVRLESVAPGREGGPDDDTEATSPCSTDVDADDRVPPRMAGYDSVDKVIKLEEATKRAMDKYEQKCLEVESLTISVSEHTLTICALNDSLKQSRKNSEDKTNKLQVATARGSEVDRRVCQLTAELQAKIEDCEALQKHIDEDLQTSLDKTGKLLEERSNALNTTRREFDHHKEMAEKTRVALEGEVGDVSERLRNTLHAMKNTQGQLAETEKIAAELEREVHGLVKEKHTNLDTIDRLSSDLDHRREALQTLRDRLVRVESNVANHEQAVIDANRSKERLTGFLTEAHDRKADAEKRAARKDEVLSDMELRTQELEHNHQIVRAHLDEKSEQLVKADRDISELSEVIQVKSTALQRQASIATKKERLFMSLANELRSVIANRSSELKAANEDVHTMERRVRSLGEMLRDGNAKLKSTDVELALSKRENSDLSAENKRQATKVVELQEEYSRLKAEHRLCQEELSLKEKELCTQAASLTEKGGKLAGLRVEKTELERLVSTTRDELSAVKGIKENQRNHIEALESALTDVAADLVNSKEELSVRCAEIGSFSRTLSDARSKAATFEKDVAKKEDEWKAVAKLLQNSEDALERTKHQLNVLELHLDGHDSLLDDCREKEELLSLKSRELHQAKEHATQIEQSLESVQGMLDVRTEEVESISEKLKTVEKARSAADKTLTKAQQAQHNAEESLKNTSASFLALKESSREEIVDLRTTAGSLRKMLEEKEDSLSSTSEDLTQSSVQRELMKEQLTDSRARGDRLFARLTSAEHELASKKETLSTLEARLKEAESKLKDRNNDVQRLEEDLSNCTQSLAVERSRLEVLSTQTTNIANGEMLTMQTKLDAKEKSVANLHNWCCFINGKLYNVENALSNRDADLETAIVALQKTENQVQELNEVISAKNSHIREVESSKNVERSELLSRIQSLKIEVCEVKSNHGDSAVDVSSETERDEGKKLAAVHVEGVEDENASKVVEVSDLKARCQALERTVADYERDLRDAHRSIESLNLEVGSLRRQAESRRRSESAVGQNTALEVSKMRSKSGYLLVEMRRMEAELAAANKNTSTWQSKVQELEPLAIATRESQRSVSMLSARLASSERDAKNRVDLLESQLEEARRERDYAERDCASALSDYAAMRARLKDTHISASALHNAIRPNIVCNVTFVLDGSSAPSSEVIVYMLGGDVVLGQWDPSRRLPLCVVSEGPNGVVRKCDVVLPANLSTMYKYTADGPDGNLVWEGGENRTLNLQQDSKLTIQDTWRSPI